MIDWSHQLIRPFVLRHFRMFDSVTQFRGAHNEFLEWIAANQLISLRARSPIEKRTAFGKALSGNRNQFVSYMVTVYESSTSSVSLSVFLVKKKKHVFCLLFYDYRHPESYELDINLKIYTNILQD